MRAQKLQEILRTCIRHKRRILIKGVPGAGKSEIVVEVTAELNADMVLFHPAISDPTTFEGFPSPTEDNGEKYATFLPFGQLRRLLNAKKPTVCFLDDIGQSAPAVQAALMQLILARQVNGNRISDEVVFVGATNDTMHHAGVSGMIEPLKSRWDSIVELEVSPDDWSTWALDHNVATELVAFIRFRPALLSKFEPTKQLTNSPSPRGWASVGNWLKAGVKDLEVFTGAVGSGAAAEFYAFLDLYTSLPSLDAILLDPVNTEVPTKPAAMYAVASGLARKATPANFERVTRYLERMPTEFNVLAVRDSVRINKAVTTSAAFVAWATKHQDVLL